MLHGLAGQLGRAGGVEGLLGCMQGGVVVRWSGSLGGQREMDLRSFIIKNFLELT